MAENTFTPGHFCWWELATTDTAGAKDFYAGLFGWTPRDIPMSETMVYTMLEKDGKQAAALYQIDAEMTAQGIPPHWGSYIGVENADETVAKAKSENATVLAEPVDVMNEGRMAVLQDPTGAQIRVWQPANHTGAHHVNEVGGVVWNELMTPDATAAGTFYGNVFGYDVNVMPFGESTYTILKSGEVQAAGVMQMDGDMWTGIPPHWMAYFGVEDCAASANRAKELGGEIKVPPTPIPGIGTFSVIADPQGAVFSIITMEMPEPSQN